MSRNRRRYDVVLFGASGFVGAQTAAYFARNAPPGLRWALAGRNAAKLEAVRVRCASSDAGIVVADAGDAAGLSALAAGARVVLSTAGPFARYGSALVAACAEHGTHYVDITGETPWVRELIDRHHARCAAEGTRIVPGCGFDSVPSDLGAWLVAQALWQQHRQRCVSVTAVVSLRGGLNGGTFASMVEMIESGKQALLRQPFLLNPPGSAPPDLSAHADPLLPHHDADFDAWLAPFVMAPINTRVVRRSASLAGLAGDEAYAPGFVYQEYLRIGRGPAAALAAAALSAGMAAGQAAMRLAPLRRAAAAFAPSPGEGPSEAAMDHGRFRCELLARGSGGQVQRGVIADSGDPGNRATTKFVCESALALALDEAQLPGGPRRGGVLTPATALGAVLARRLVAAGMRVEPLPPP